MKRLLLVHDNNLFREALALLLQWQTGLDSVEAGSAAEARRIFLGEPHHDEVCLAIVDIDLPNEDGIELIKELRELEPDCPVLALTTTRSMQKHVQALQAEAEEVFTIGKSIEELTDAVRRLAVDVPGREQGLGRLAPTLFARSVDPRVY